uniref:Uncharacterized protein n=1 Tax=Tanacetum cinerariifolium TaxID=118510 RepID=A0A699RKC6_TANCI|nr:hypothetical protein [Tanacetum cinerariifolium]
MKEGFQEGFVHSMDEEVAEDTSDSAKFMTSNEVRNVMEDNDIPMQGKGVGLQWGGILMLLVPNCCLTPVRENNVKDMRDLWKNLREHNSIAGCFPWVLLGDFNVILYYNENSNGINA